MGDKDIIALNNRICKFWFTYHYKAYQPSTVLLDNTLTSMGAGLSSVMMA